MATRKENVGLEDIRALPIGLNVVLVLVMFAFINFNGMVMAES